MWEKLYRRLILQSELITAMSSVWDNNFIKVFSQETDTVSAIHKTYKEAHGIPLLLTYY